MFGTCVLTIACWNNFAHVLTFVENAAPQNQMEWVWAVADRPDFSFFDATSKELLGSIGKVAPPWLRIATLNDLQPFATFPLLELAMKYNLVEFNTAIKPIAILYCFQFGSKVLYFDNDVWIQQSLREIEILLDRYSVVVTPHITSPMPLDGLRQTDTQISMAGIFNFGFVAFCNTEATRAFLDWWTLRLRFYGFVDTKRGMHFDQGWGDFIPAFFDDFFVLRDERFNVAYWNLHYTGRSLTLRGDDENKVYVNGRPVVFLHFSGVSNFRFYRSHEISRHQTRYTLFDFPNLKPILSEYTSMLRRRNATSYRRIPYGYHYLDNGIKIIPVMRELFAQVLDPECDERRQRYFLSQVNANNPFDGTMPAVRVKPTKNISFLQWLFEGPYELGVDLVGDSYLPEILWHVSDLTPKNWSSLGRAQIWHWFLTDYLETEDGAGRGVKMLAASMFLQHRERNATTCAFGVNLLGWLHGSWGVAKSAHRLEAIFCRARTPVYPLEFPFLAPNFEFEDSTLCHVSPRVAPYAVNLFVANADVTTNVFRHFPKSMRDDHYNIGYWAWELGRFPSRWIPNLAAYDEIWVPSTFVRNALVTHPKFKNYERPVVVVPPVSATTRRRRRRPRLSTTKNTTVMSMSPSDYVFLVVFDYQSCFERKNALAAVRAFALAFPSSTTTTTSSARMILKCRLGTAKKRSIHKLHELVMREVGRVRNVHLIDRVLPAAELESLVSRADCLVSLHRGEGFGLDVWDTLVQGKPAIVTNFSGCVDTIRDAYVAVCATDPARFILPCERHPWLVSYDLEPIARTWGPYPSGALWARPDVRVAATVMRDVVRHSRTHAEFARALADVLLARHGISRAVDVVEARLSSIRATLESKRHRCAAVANPPGDAVCRARCAETTTSILRSLPPVPRLYPNANLSSSPRRPPGKSVDPLPPKNFVTRRKNAALVLSPASLEEHNKKDRGNTTSVDTVSHQADVRKPRDLPGWVLIHHTPNVLGSAALVLTLILGFSPTVLRRRVQRVLR